MEVFKKIADIAVFLILILCIVADGIFIYNKWFAPEKTTTGDINLSLIDTPNGKTEFCEINFYENKDNSGIALFEIKFNYHVNQEDYQTHTSGLQIIGEPQIEYKRVVKSSKPYGFLNLGTQVFSTNEITNNIYYYKVGKAMSYTNADEYSFDEAFKINLDDKSYQFSFGREMYNLNSDALHYETMLSSPWIFAEKLYTAIKDNKIGTGFNTFEFKEMFTVSEYTENGKFDTELDLVDEIMSHLYIKVNHYTTGAKTYEDSIFKRIQNNSHFSIEGSVSTSNYFADKSFYKITENDFIFTYNEEAGGHIAKLNKKCFNFINKNKIKNLEIVINNDYLKSLNIVLKKVSTDYLNELGLTKYTLIENNIASGVELWN